MHTLPLAEAARLLRLHPDAVRSLVVAGYLSSVGDNDDLIPLADVKAFRARNTDSGANLVLSLEAESPDSTALLEALDEVIADLAGQAFEAFARVIPEARNWGNDQRTNFVQQAKGRFGAILAVTEQGAEVDDALRADLEAVGANAAWAGTSLPHLLLVLRISRDLLLRAAITLAAAHNGRWNETLLSFARRMLPAIERMTDALTDGFWSARVEQHQEKWERVAPLIEGSPYGVYVVDVDGLVQYANPAFAALVGRNDDELEGVPLSELLRPIEGAATVASLLSEPDNGIGQTSFAVPGPDGQAVTLQIDTVVRRVNSDALGFAGIVRRVTPAAEDQEDTSWMARHVYELKRSLEILGEAGGFLMRHAADMSDEQVAQAGESIQRQSERLERIVDEMDEERKTLAAPLDS